MNKACASILIFVALFALVGAEDFMRIPLDQGTLRMRNLASSSSQSYTFDNFTNNFGVRVNLSSTYLTAIGLDNNTQTDMTLFLYTNVTGFCQNCAEFIPFGCGGNNCSYDSSQYQTMYNGPNYYVTSGNAFNFSNLTIGVDNTTAAWKLNTTAFYFNNGPAFSKSIFSPYSSGSTSGMSYIKTQSTYGFVGLGVGGNASKNFQTATPIFSIQVNGSGSGSLIFGKDTTYIDSSKTAMTFTTDTNWTMTSRNMSWGSTINSASFYSYVIFDLQAPGVILPSQYKSDFWSTFYTKYSLTSNTTFGNTDFPLTYSGALTGLPDLSIGLTNDKNITIPPAAYTRKLATNFYAILIGFTDQVYNQSSGGSYVNYTVIGWPVLSQFYTVFELPTTGVPTVTMYPASTAASGNGSTGSSFSLKTLAIVAAVVLVVLVALSAVCKKKQDFTKSDLGVELRAARV